MEDRSLRRLAWARDFSIMRHIWPSMIQAVRCSTPVSEMLCCRQDTRAKPFLGERALLLLATWLQTTQGLTPPAPASLVAWPARCSRAGRCGRPAGTTRGERDRGCDRARSGPERAKYKGIRNS